MALTKADLESIAAMIAGAQKPQEAAPAATPEAQKTSQAARVNRASNTAKVAAKQAISPANTSKCDCTRCGSTFDRPTGKQGTKCPTCRDAADTAYKSAHNLLDTLGVPRKHETQDRNLSLEERVLRIPLDD